MKKIISLFERDYNGNRLVVNKIVSGAEWVSAGEGVATRKYDGTCCMIKGGLLYKRYDAKNGKQPPYGFIPAQDPDPITGHWPGWIEVGNGAEDKYHREAFDNLPDSYKDRPGTYELVGPKIQGNPEGYVDHRLICHDEAQILFPPTDYEKLKEWFVGKDIEGIVWHHPDGRMVKIKAKDFGIKRNKSSEITKD